MLLFRILNNFYKLSVILSFVAKKKRIDHISNILSKRYDVFTENVIAIVKMQEKLETYRNLNVINFRRSSSGDHINLKYRLGL